MQMKKYVKGGGAVEVKSRDGSERLYVEVNAWQRWLPSFIGHRSSVVGRPRAEGGRWNGRHWTHARGESTALYHVQLHLLPSKVNTYHEYHYVEMSQLPSSSKSPIPANLRFQRRTSEREFYEGAFKPGSSNLSRNNSTTNTNMDYSQAINQDSDHPAGSSPWETGSPQQARDGFGSSAGNSSSHVNSSPYGRSSVDHMDRPSTDNSTSTTSTENGHTPNSPSPYLKQSQQYSQQQSQQYSQQQYSQQQSQPYPQQHSQQHAYPQRQHSHQDNNQPQRYHGNPRLQAQVHHQQQQQQAPRPPTQYKLSMKITGLERSGRKDAVIVFDAQVSHVFLIPLTSVTLSY